LYEINPYLKLTVYLQGLNKKNINSIVNKNNLIIEEMDDPYWKIKIREHAKLKNVPVIMGTDNGDGVIVDIERYDLNKNYPIFHGIAGSLTSQQIKNLEPKDLPKIAAKIAGANLASIRMLESVAQVGKTLYSWPQLGTAANLCGSAITYIARKIILKDPLIKSGRYEVNLDAIFETNYNSQKQIKLRNKQRLQILKQLQ
jgi:hypothetical protein